MLRNRDRVVIAHHAFTRSRVGRRGHAFWKSNALKRRVVSRGVVIPTEFGVGVVKYPPAVATLPAELRFSQTTTPCGVTPWTPLPQFMKLHVKICAWSECTHGQGRNGTQTMRKPDAADEETGSLRMRKPDPALRKPELTGPEGAAQF